MYNLGDDKELDRVSREAAGRYSPPGKANWQALSEELDRVMPVEEKKKRRFLFWWLLPLAALGGMAVYWLNAGGSADEALVTKTASPITVGKSKNSNTPITETKPLTVPADEAKQKTEKPSMVIQQPKAAQQNITDQTLTLQTQINTTKNKNRLNRTTLVSRNSAEPKVASEAVTPLEKNTVDQNKAAQIPTLLLQPIKEKTGTTETVQQKQAAQQENPPLTETKEKQPENNADTNVTVAAAAPVVTVKNKRGKGFSYAFVAGVDKSTVKFRYGNDPGVNLGILAGYHFNSHWSVHTGVVYTQKNYKVAGEDFTAPKGSWASYLNIKDVTGSCRMWEIPLLARYTMGNTGNKSSFISAGLSSYFMTKESYDYFYYINGQPATRSISLNSDDKHILSVLHLSVGFERMISKKWGVQVEPYAKLPLGGVGYGSIKLSSFGLNFSLQHRQPAKK